MMKVYRLTEMPESSEEYYSEDNDILVRYIGPTTEKYVNGYFYRSVEEIIDTTVPDHVYSKDGQWSRIYQYDIDYEISATAYQAYIYIDGTEYYTGSGEGVSWKGNLPANASLQFRCNVGRWIKNINLHHDGFTWEEASEYNTKVFTRDNIIYLLNQLTEKLQINHIGE